MSDTAGQQSELLERFGFATFGFGALAFGDVAEHEDHASHFILVVANWRSDFLDDSLASIARNECRIFRKIQEN